MVVYKKKSKIPVSNLKKLSKSKLSLRISRAFDKSLKVVFSELKKYMATYKRKLILSYNNLSQLSILLKEIHGFIVVDFDMKYVLA